MNAKLLFLMLLGVGVLFGATALLKSGQEQSTSSKGEILLPELQKHVNDVRKLTLSLQGEEWIFDRQSNGQWTLPSRENYPADRKKLDQLVLGLAQAKKLSLKTSKPERYGSLGLDAASEEEDNQPARVEIFDRESNSLAALWVGNRRSGTTKESYFVRVEQDPTCWLVSGNLRVEKKGLAWMDATLTDIASQEIQSVRLVHPDGEQILLGKEADAAPGAALQILNLPAGQEPQSEFVTSRFAAALQALRMEDVLPIGDVPMPKDEVVLADFWTEDGLKVTVTTLEQDDKIYAQFSAAYDRDGALKPYEGPTVEGELPNVLDPSTPGASTPEEEPGKKSAEDVQVEANALNAKTKDWVYVLPNWKGSALRGRMEELLKKPDESNPLDGGGSGLIPQEGPTLLNPNEVKSLDEGMLDGAQGNADQGVAPQGQAPNAPSGAETTPGAPAGGSPADPKTAGDSPGVPAVDPKADPAIAPGESQGETKEESGTGSKPTPASTPPASTPEKKSSPVFEIDPDAVKETPADKPSPANKKPQNKKEKDGDSV